MPFGVVGWMGSEMRQVVWFGDRSTGRRNVGANMGRYIVTNGPCGQRHGLFPNYFGYLLMYITVGTVYRIYLGNFKTACCHVDLVVVKCVDMCYTRIFVVCAYSDLRITYTCLSFPVVPLTAQSACFVKRTLMNI